MKIQTAFLVFFWLFNSSTSLAAGVVSGVIYFEDGTTQNFNELTAISAFLDGTHRTAQQDGITVEYKNTIRMIPYSKLKSIEVLKYKVEKSKRLNKEYLKESQLRIVTTTGVTLKMTFLSVHSIYAILLDDLTGELINQDIAFAKDNELNVRKIEFKHPAE